jgi:N-acetylated-alpha-linked acidic dipeptidase
VRGTVSPDEWVVAGNHRDAWVYGAVDPNSGTAAMIESVHGIGELLKSGWKPKRTIVIGSWDAEEEGLIGSTEWGEDHAKELANAAAYFNMDVAVSGPKFGASSVPSLKQFIRDITKAVPSPPGGTVYDVWKKAGQQEVRPQETSTSTYRPPAAQVRSDVPVGDLGSGSDYTVFLQHLGVPSTDVGSTGDYGVYHSAFDNFAWFKKFGDPDFRYEQQMARVYGLEVVRMAGADLLPYNYEDYGKEILVYLDAAKNKAKDRFGGKALDFSAAVEGARHLEQAGAKMLQKQRKLPGDAERLNATLRDTERALLIPEGLPNRPWYHHAIYAPGQYTGYAAVVIPGVNEAIDSNDLKRTEQQIAALAAALQRAAMMLEQHR